MMNKITPFLICLLSTSSSRVHTSHKETNIWQSAYVNSVQLPNNSDNYNNETTPSTHINKIYILAISPFLLGNHKQFSSFKLFSGTPFLFLLYYIGGGQDFLPVYHKRHSASNRFQRSSVLSTSRCHLWSCWNHSLCVFLISIFNAIDNSSFHRCATMC